MLSARKNKSDVWRHFTKLWPWWACSRPPTVRCQSISSVPFPSPLVAQSRRRSHTSNAAADANKQIKYSSGQVYKIDIRIYTGFSNAISRFEENSILTSLSAINKKWAQNPGYSYPKYNKLQLNNNWINYADNKRN